MTDGISVWIPVITALAGIGGALGSQYFSHRFTLNREKKASEDKMMRERILLLQSWSLSWSCLREIALQQNNVERSIARHLDPKGGVEKMEAVIFDVFKKRQYQYTRLGVKAMIQARRLRKLVNLPISQFDNQGWTTESVLWRSWRKNRADEVTQHREYTAEVANSLTMKKVTKENGWFPA